jgi:hypothetical protein
MTKFEYFHKFELKAYEIAAANHSWNHNDRVDEETSKILEEWYDDYCQERD